MEIGTNGVPFDIISFSTADAYAKNTAMWSGWSHRLQVSDEEQSWWELSLPK